MKYKDKLQFFPNCEYDLIVFDIHDTHIIGSSFDEVVEQYRKTFLKSIDTSNCKFIKVVIMRNRSEVSNKFDSKDWPFDKRCIKYSENAYERTVYLASDISEVYGECFWLSHEADNNPIPGNTEFIFDYNILYGDFEAKEGEYFKYNNLKFKFWHSVSKESTYKADLMMCLRGITINNDGKERVIDGIWDSFIPSSQLQKI